MIERLIILIVLVLLTAACASREYDPDDPDTWSAHQLHSYGVQHRIPPPAPEYRAPRPAVPWPYAWD